MKAKWPEPSGGLFFPGSLISPKSVLNALGHLVQIEPSFHASIFGFGLVDFARKGILGHPEIARLIHFCEEKGKNLLRRKSKEIREKPVFLQF